MNTKFMQTLDERVYRDLSNRAKNRGVTVQEFLRAVVVPYYMRNSQEIEEHAIAKQRTR